MYAVDVYGESLVAVGIDSQGGGVDAAVWTSSDGVSWERLDIDENTLGGEGEQAMRWVIGFNELLVGAGWSGDPTSGESDAVVWYTRSAEQDDE